MGIENVGHIGTGLSGWKEAGGPIEEVEEVEEEVSKE